MKVIEIRSDSKGVVELDGHRRVVNLSLVDGVELGGYVVVHAGFAIETLDQKEADSVLGFFRRMVLKDSGNRGAAEPVGMNYIDDFRAPEVADGFFDLIATQCSVLAAQWI
jgi:hydrogenase expression/formation protein HypC